MTQQPVWKRVLLKLSGEALMGDLTYGIDQDRLRAVAAVGLTMPAPATNVPRLASAVRTAAAAVSRDHARWAEELW